MNCWLKEQINLLIRGSVSSPEKKQMGDYTHSTAVINACRPYVWKNEFLPTIMSTPEELEGVKKKWGKLFEKA